MVLGGLQPSYLPWIGYFEQIHKSDVFVLLDELQYQKYSWRHRNKIKSNNGWAWLIVPVTGDVMGQPIRDIRIDNSRNWRKKHWQTLRHVYGKTPWFPKYKTGLETIYQKEWERLSDLNIAITRELCRLLGIDTKLVVSSELELESKFQHALPDGNATDRIVFYCKELGADVLYEGYAGQDYIDESKFRAESIRVEYQEYDHPVYPQSDDTFISHLSVVDLLFSQGEKSLEILTGQSCTKPVQ